LPSGDEAGASSPDGKLGLRDQWLSSSPDGTFQGWRITHCCGLFVETALAYAGNLIPLRNWIGRVA